MTDPIYKALTTIRDRYAHDPELDMEDGFRPRMHALAGKANKVAGNYWESFAASSDGRVDGETAMEWAMEARARGISEVLDQYVAQTLPIRAVHDVRYGAIYEEASTQRPLPTHIDEPGSDRFLVARAEASGAHTEQLGIPADYSGLDPIEDVTIPPEVPWTAADKVAALERLIARDGIDPGHWYELDWPPKAHLWDTGHVFETEWKPCEKHSDQLASEGCTDCDASVREVVESPAQWKFTTEVRTLRLGFDEGGNEIEVHVAVERDYEVGELSQDPRQILVGEPGVGARR